MQKTAALEYRNNHLLASDRTAAATKSSGLLRCVAREIVRGEQSTSGRSYPWIPVMLAHILTRFKGEPPPSRLRRCSSAQSALATSSVSRSESGPRDRAAR